MASFNPPIALKYYSTTTALTMVTAAATDIVQRGNSSANMTVPFCSWTGAFPILKATGDGVSLDDVFAL